MPRATRRKYYAVRTGREGPKIYDTWAEVSLLFRGSAEDHSACISVQRKREPRFHRDLIDASLKILHQICRWPGAIHKSFQSRDEAEQWLALPRASKYLNTVIATLLSTRSHDTIFEYVI